jgi:hypothetical protein
MVIFVVYSLGLLMKPAAQEFVMKLHVGPMSGWLGYVSAAIIGAILLCGYWWLTGKMLTVGSDKNAKPEKPPTLTDLFKSDLGNTLKLTTEDSIAIQWKNGDMTPVKAQLYVDFNAKVKFLGFYIPSVTSRTYEACLRLADTVESAIDNFQKNVGVQGGYRSEIDDLKTLMFSGRVLLYHEDFLSIPQKAQIIKTYSSKRFDVQFRGPDYLGDQVISWHHQHDAKGAK